eukprot:COSAG04_NODE_10349_length_784_cov_1.364964_1_plen_103_part_00
MAVWAGGAFSVGDVLATVRTMEGELLQEVKAEIPGFVFDCKPHDCCWHLGCILPRVPAIIVRTGDSSGVTKSGRVSLGIVGTPDGGPMLLDWAVLLPIAGKL